MQATKDATPSLEDEASVIQEKYETLLTLFSQRHSKYNSSNAVVDAEIDVLGTTPTLSNYLSVMHMNYFFFLSHICKTFFYLLNRTRHRGICHFLQEQLPRCYLPPKDAHAWGTCRPILEKMALSSQILW